MLKFDRQAYLSALESGEPIGEEGVDEAIELVTEITSRYAQCFVRINQTLY